MRPGRYPLDHPLEQLARQKQAQRANEERRGRLVLAPVTVVQAPSAVSEPAPKKPKRKRW